MRIDGILKESKINKEPGNMEQPISALGLVRFIYFTECFITCTHMPLKNYLFIIWHFLTWVICFEDSLSNDLEYLKNYSEPFADVKNAFERTSELRKQILHQQKVSVFDYMSSVKSLRLDQQGQELVNIFYKLLLTDKNF